MGASLRQSRLHRRAESLDIYSLQQGPVVGVGQNCSSRVQIEPTNRIDLVVRHVGTGIHSHRPVNDGLVAILSISVEDWR